MALYALQSPPMEMVASWSIAEKNEGSKSSPWRQKGLLLPRQTDPTLVKGVIFIPPSGVPAWRESPAPACVALGDRK